MKATWLTPWTEDMLYWRMQYSQQLVQSQKHTPVVMYHREN